MLGSIRVKNNKLRIIIASFIFICQLLSIIVISLVNSKSELVKIYIFSIINFLSGLVYYTISKKYGFYWIINFLDIFIIFISDTSKVLGSIYIISFIRLITNLFIILGAEKDLMPYPITNKTFYIVFSLILKITFFLPLYFSFIYNYYYLLLYLIYFILLCVYYALTNIYQYKRMYIRAIKNNKMLEVKKDIEEETKSLINLLRSYHFLRSGYYLEGIKAFEIVKDIKNYELDLYYTIKTLISMHLEDNKYKEILRHGKKIISNIKKPIKRKLLKAYRHKIEILELVSKEKNVLLKDLINPKKYFLDYIFIDFIEQKQTGITKILRKTIHQ